MTTDKEAGAGASGVDARVSGHLAEALTTEVEWLLARNSLDWVQVESLAERLRGYTHAAQQLLDLRGGGPSIRSAEQLAISLTAMANRLFDMGGTIGHDEHGFRNMGDQLAGWAEDVRQLGVQQLAYRDNYKQQWEAIEAKLDQVRELVRELPLYAAGSVMESRIRTLKGVLGE